MMETSDKNISFIHYWISENDTKAVVTLSAWKDFEKKWNLELGDLEETKNSFFANMRGIITPYRTKYASEARLEVDIDKESLEIDEKTIVNWHYASVEYLLTNNPDHYISSSPQLKIPAKSVLTPKQLYSRLEVEDGEIIEGFRMHWED